WNDPGITALTATFLDPRFKDLNFLTHVKRKEVHKYIHNLILKYLENNNQCNLNDIEENSGSLKSALSLFFEDVSAKGFIELENYQDQNKYYKGIFTNIKDNELVMIDFHEHLENVYKMHFFTYNSHCNVSYKATYCLESYNENINKDHESCEDSYQTMD
ncbi:14857_t:CDS:2, partial [Entrophospora sp. SA101]